MLTAKKVADYFLSLVDEEAGDSLTNLKLQKLVYYAQGFSLVLLGDRLFPEPIEAWEHGPVVPALYRSFKEHGSQPIPPPVHLNRDEYPAAVVELLDEVYAVYGQFSASKLRRMTHEEPPWKEAYPSSQVQMESMRRYFSTLVNGKESPKA